MTASARGKGMTPAEFASQADQIAGPRWRSAIGPVIGKCRTQVWEYANGHRAVPETVEKLMRELVKPPRSLASR